MLPFTPEVFFALFGEYNLAIWPAQVLAYALGLLALILAVRPTAWSGKVTGTVLAALWLWTGVVYHGLYFAIINVAAPLFAALFALEALLIAWRLTVRGDIAIAFTNTLTGWAGLAMMVFALAVYPALAALADHGWPQGAMFGVAPCPLTIFTFGILLLTRPRAPLALAAIPLAWAAIGGSAVWFIGIPEDAGLPVAGVAALALMVRRN